MGGRSKPLSASRKSAAGVRFGLHIASTPRFWAVFGARRAVFAAFEVLRCVVLEAVKQNGGAFAYADASLRADRALASEAVRRSGLALQFAAEHLRHDRELVLRACEHQGFALQFAPEALRRDVAIARAAVRQHGDALRLLPEALRSDAKLVLEALKAVPVAELKADALSDAEMQQALVRRPRATSDSWVLRGSTVHFTAISGISWPMNGDGSV